MSERCHMEVLLILREEIACLFVLLFFFVYGWIYGKGSNQKRFLRFNVYAILHVGFDLITVYTVNHLELIPNGVNVGLHGIFYVTGILYACEFFCYVLSLITTEEWVKRAEKICWGIVVLYCVSIPTFGITFTRGKGTNYSLGTSIYIGFLLTVVMFIIGIGVMLWNYKKINRTVKYTIIAIAVWMIICMFLQAAIPEFLFTGAGITCVTVVIFFLIENPVEQYREKAYIDMDTGIKNKNCFEEEMEALERKYIKRQQEIVIGCVVCDLNGLKAINDHYGHIAGDRLIQTAAKILEKNLESAYGVYRTGGDEFIAFYITPDQQVVEKEIGRVRNACQNTTVAIRTKLSIAIGYAQSDEIEDEGTMRELIQKADRRMYQNKAVIKSKESEGIRGSRV